MPWTWPAFLAFIIVDLYGTSDPQQIPAPAPAFAPEVAPMDVVLMTDGTTCTAVGDHPDPAYFYCVRPEVVDPPPELFWLPYVTSYLDTAIAVRLGTSQPVPQ